MKTKQLKKTRIMASIGICIMILGGGQVGAFSINIEQDDIDTVVTNMEKSQLKDQLLESAEGLIGRVRNELRTFVKNGLDDIVLYNTPELQEKISIIEKPQIMVNYAPMDINILAKQYFQDIENSPYMAAINLLASCDIIQTHTKKFYPQNFIRLHELVKILENTYEYKHEHEYGKNHLLTFRDEKKLSLVGVPEHYQLAYEIGMLEGIENITNFERFVDAKIYEHILENFSIYESGIDTKILTSKIYTEGFIQRDVLAENIVQLFGLEQLKQSKHQKNLYDIRGKEAVEILIAKNMYPFSSLKEGTVSREGFAQFLAQVSSVRSHENLATFVKRGKQKYSDVNYPQQGYMYYLEYKKLLDYLIEQKRGKYYFYPEKMITQHEVYHILGEFCGKKWEYDEVSLDNALVSYSRLSEKFVQCLSSSFQQEYLEKQVSYTGMGINVKKEPVLSLWNTLISKK